MFRPLGVAVWAGFLLSLLAGQARATDPVQDLWKQQADLLKLNAEKASLEYVLGLPGKATKPVQNRDIPKALQEHLTTSLAKSDYLKKNSDKIRTTLTGRLAELEQEGKVALTALESIWIRHLTLRLRQAEMEACCECPLDEEPPLLPGRPALARLVLWGGVIFLLGVLFALSRMSRQRRPMWQRSPVKLGLILWLLAALVVTGSVAWLREVNQSWIPGPWSPGDAMVKRQRVLDEVAADLHGRATILQGEVTSLQSRWSDLKRQQTRRFASRLGISSDAVQASEDDTLDLLRRILAQILLNREIQERLTPLATEADALAARLDAEEARLAVRLQERVRVRWGALSVVLVIAVLPWLVGVWPWGAKVDRRCPRCVARSLLTGPEATCRVCGYRLGGRLGRMKRLSFAVIGRRGSGKTHWLAEFAHQLAQGHSPAGGSLHLAPWEANDRYTRIAQDVWQRRKGVEQTPHQDDSLPTPLLVHFQGAAEEVLIQLVDLPGEVCDLPSSSVRRRALEMSGFVYFLDVLQSGEAQQKCLEEFLVELRLRQGVARGAISVPVAVCLSRIDLAVSRGEEGWSGWFDELHRTARSRPNVETLHRRSELIESRLSLLFSGVDLAALLRRELEDNVLFFATSSVGIEVTDEPALSPEIDGLRERMLVPFGTLEPVLWLLHRHGYAALD